MDVQEVKKLDAYLRKLFGNPSIRVVPRSAKSAEVFVGEDDLGELTLDDEEPLHAELASFVRAVRDGTPPEVSADEALRALEAADAVLAQIRSRRW